MSEFKSRARRAFLPAAATVAVACAIFSYKSLESEPIDPLHVGDKVTDVPLVTLTTEINEGQSYSITPTQTTQPEAMAIVYSPNISEVFVETLGVDGKGERMGFMLTSYPGRIAMNMVVFDAKTKRIDEISPALNLEDEVDQTIVTLFDRQEVPYVLSLRAHESNGHTVDVSFVNQLPDDADSYGGLTA